MSRIGIVPGQDFDIAKLYPATAAALQKVPDLAQARIEAALPIMGTMLNGWNVPLDTGVYGLTT